MGTDYFILAQEDQVLFELGKNWGNLNDEKTLLDQVLRDLPRIKDCDETYVLEVKRRLMDFFGRHKGPFVLVNDSAHDMDEEFVVGDRYSETAYPWAKAELLERNSVYVDWQTSKRIEAYCQYHGIT